MPDNLSKEEKAILKDIAKKEKENIIQTSFLETEKYIAEQIDIKDPRFVLYNKITGSTEYVKNVEFKGKEYFPINDELMKKGAIQLPTDIEEYGTDKELIDEITDYLYTYFEVPPFYEMFLPYLIMFYWVYDKFPFVPYVHFVGLTGTGKTTAQETFGSICYKPIDVAGAITMSPIFRVATEWKGTLLLDEFEPGGDAYKEIILLLKTGVGNKAVLRTEGDKEKKVQVYTIKSPKIFTSEKPITDAGLQSRTLVIHMSKTKKRIPLYKLEDDIDAAIHIRNKLLLWRLRNLNKIDLRQIKYGYEELRAFDRRVQQVVTPIYYLSDDVTRESIVGFAKVQEEETKKERQESIEGQIFYYMATHADPITIVEVTSFLNQDRNNLQKISEKKTANLIRKVLGFEIKREGHDNKRVIVTEGMQDKLEQLSEYFAIPLARFASVAEVAEETNAKEDQQEIIYL